MKLILIALACAFFASLGSLARADDAGVPTPQDKQTLTKLEDKFIDAAKARDGAALKEMLGADLIMTRPSGDTCSRDQFIDGVTSGVYDIESGANSDLRIRVYGDTSVVTGNLNIKGSANNNDISGDYRYTDVFVKRAGKWVKVATHYSRGKDQ
jgi:ketosteroid isomerase-like protein